MKRDHSKLAPVSFDFVPKGRSKVDAEAYKLLRWYARVSRQAVYDATLAAWRDMFTNGIGYFRVHFSAPCTVVDPLPWKLG